MFRLTFAVAALASLASGHLMISSPAPISGQSKNPLAKSGANFPCHRTQGRNSDLPASGGAPMQAGSSQKLTFDGGPTGFNSAVHGGGSCQISITYETDYAKVKDPANWRVIKSIEGGCPTNTAMNLDGDDAPHNTFYGPKGPYTGSFQCSDGKTNGVDCLNAFEFDLPKDLPTGHATIAWTWFNNVGNREFYMNCASADIQGGSSNTDSLNALPQMFVANLAGINQCSTTPNVNVKFPNPGSQLEQKEPAPLAAFAAKAQTGNYPLQVPSGEGCDANSGGSTPPTTTEVPEPPATTAPPASSSSGGVFGPGTGTSFTTKVSTVTASTPAAPAPSPSSPSGSCQYPCSEDGAIVCMAGNKFGLCNFGCAVPQPMAPGMKCANGAMEAIAVGKRHPHGFAHRNKAALL